jgi:hypothetical protein
MTSAQKPVSPPDGMSKLRDLLGRVRRALTQDDMVELGRLMPLLAALATAPGLAPGDDPAGLRNDLLALLDEASRLTGELGEERARLAAQLRGAGAHRRAGVAYRRAGRL